jgi:hypothetical protein
VLSDSFTAIQRAPIPVLRFQTHFRRYRGRRVPFTCFTLPNSFSSVSVASIPVFMISAPELIYGGTEGVTSHLHNMLSRTHFLRYRGRHVPFSCFAFSDSFSTVKMAPGPVFIFCAFRLIFGVTEGVGSRFHVLRSRTHFRRYRRRRVPFTCLALPDSFSAIPRVSCPVFFFGTPGVVFGNAEVVGTRFHVFFSQTHFQRVLRASCPVFEYCSFGLVFDDTESVGSQFHV